MVEIEHTFCLREAWRAAAEAAKARAQSGLESQSREHDEQASEMHDDDEVSEIEIEASSSSSSFNSPFLEATKGRRRRGESNLSGDRRGESKESYSESEPEPFGFLIFF